MSRLSDHAALGPAAAVTPGTTLPDLVGQDVAVLGAGREGLAIRDRLRTVAPGQALTFYSESALDEAAAAGLDPRDRLVIGPLDGERLSRHDLLVRSPGVSPYRPALAQARNAGVRFTSGTNLWLAANPGARTIAVTGTKGKSTTTALLRHLLAAAGVRVDVAGNIGVPLVACDADAADWWVVELSSYQLCDLVERPSVGVLLNLSDEHLDWHGGADVYRRDKLRLADLATTVWANHGDPGLVKALGDRSGVHWFNGPGRPEVRDGALMEGGARLPGLPSAPGEHNLANLAAALAVVDDLAHRPADLADCLEAFRGLPHRLEFIGRHGGVTWVDDSLSTTPVATLAALRALRDGPVTVLVGGLDRGVDWRGHAEALRAARPHALVGLPDSGAAILAALRDEGLAPPGGFHEAEDMAQAVRRARAVTPDGGTVLLSPGAPSFPRYRDYRARAEAFRHEVSAGRTSTDPG